MYSEILTIITFASKHCRLPQFNGTKCYFINRQTKIHRSCVFGFKSTQLHVSAFANRPSSGLVHQNSKRGEISPYKQLIQSYCKCKNFYSWHWIISYKNSKIFTIVRKGFSPLYSSCVLLPNMIMTDVKVMVKFFLYRPGVAQRLGRGIALLFHDSGTRRGWVVSSTPRPQFTPGKDQVTILQEAGWAPGLVWTGGKSRPHRYSITDRPVRSQSLYQLSYPAQDGWCRQSKRVTVSNKIQINEIYIAVFIGK